MSRTTWQPGQIEALAKSTEQFPVDFDDAWVWVGYSTKGNGKRSLEANFEEGLDYRSFIISDKRAIGGTTREVIQLTTDCFKQFCMMAGTEQGKAVRKYFIQCEQELKHFLSKSQSQRIPLSHQINADPAGFLISNQKCLPTQ